jgi:hypothetical protein
MWGMRHADICEQKGIYSYELACAHKKRSEISVESAFLDSSLFSGDLASFLVCARKFI